MAFPIPKRQRKPKEYKQKRQRKETVAKRLKISELAFSGF
jgi:hypothetical protein